VRAAVGGISSGGTPITVTFGKAAALAIRTQPAGAAAGQTLATQPVVEIRDAAGNLVATSTAVVTASIASGSGSLAGATANAVGGVATFTGLVVSGTVGDRTIRFAATDAGSVTSAPFPLAAGPPSAITISPSSANLIVGSTKQLSAQITDASGNSLPGEITWTSSAIGVATVSSTGLVSGVTLGSASITAASGGRSAVAPVQVTGPLSFDWTVADAGDPYLYHGIFARSLNDIFAVGSGTGKGSVLHWDGSAWTRTLVSGDVFAVSANSSGNVVMVGGAIYSWTGSAVSFVAGTPGYLRAIWHAPSGKAFAVGDRGTIMMFDGSQWSQMTSGTTATLWGVWGTSATDVFIAGDSGILHFDGNSWTQVAGVTASLRAVWGTASNNVYSSGWQETLLHFDGSSWKSVELCASQPGIICLKADLLNGLGGSSATNVFTAASTNIHHFNGQSWTLSPLDDDVRFRSIYGFAGIDDSHVYAIGEGGGVLRWNGASWSESRHGSRTLRGVAAAPDGRVYAVGDGGTFLRLDGSTWSEATSPMRGFLSSISVAADGSIFVGASELNQSGTSSETVVWRLAGGIWSRTTIPPAFGSRAVWAASANDAYSVDEQGVVFHFNGSGWSQSLALPKTVNVLGNAAAAGSGPNDVYVGSSFGSIGHFDGSSWQTINAGAPVNALYAPGGGVAFAATNSNVLMVSGSSASTLQPGTSCEIEGMTGRSTIDITVVTFCGEISHYDGASWKVVSFPNVPLSGVAQRGSSAAVAVGAFGVILSGSR
jgi:hypothetical protein